MEHKLSTQLLQVVRTTFRTRKATAAEVRKIADLMCGMRRAPDFTEQQLAVVIDKYQPTTQTSAPLKIMSTASAVAQVTV